MQTMTTAAVSFVDGGGARLAVYDEGAGKPILLLHGGPGVPDYLAPVSALLASTHRVIRFDQRGTGQSTCESGRYALTDYVSDVHAVRAACGVDRIALFGHSWGGTVAQLYAAHRPDCVSRMCLSNSGIGVGNDWQAMERAVMRFNRRRGGIGGFAKLGLDQMLAMLPGAIGDAAARRMMARVWTHYFHPPASAPAPAAAWLAGVHRRPIFATRRAALRADASALRDLPSSIPVLIIFGDDDIYGETTARLLARHPSARTVVIRRCGHVPWLQSPETFRSELLAFFR